MQQFAWRSFAIFFLLTTLVACGSSGSSNDKPKKRALDKTPPELTLNGNEIITLEAGTEYQELGAKATDKVDGELDVTIDGTVDINTLGTYILTYSATDSSGNEHSIQREIQVVDTTAPRLILLGQSNHTVEALTEFSDPGALAEDTLDGDLNVTVEGSVNMSAIGVYTLSYSATDSSGNYTSIQRQVHVVDTTAPQIALNGGSLLIWQADTEFVDPGAHSEDTLEGNLPVSISGEVDTSEPGRYQIVYSTRDSSGNESTIQRTVKISAFRPFITTWQTDKPGGKSQDNQIRIQTVDSGANFTVDWGDDHIDENLTGTTTHTYDSAGIYTIKIYGNLPFIRHSTSPLGNAESKKLLSLDQWGDIRWQSMGSAFANAQSMIYQAKDVPDLSQVTNMSDMFRRAEALDGNLSQWDVSEVTNMYSMFGEAKAFNGDISQWDVSQVTNMGRMFQRAEMFNADISQWDVSQVTDMHYMFWDAEIFNSDVSQWDVSNVTDMSSMFSGAEIFNSDVSQWDVSNVTDMSRMFYGANAFNSDISQWDVSNVTDMSSMFIDAQTFNSDLSQWDVSNVTNMRGMFNGAELFNGDLSQWDVSNVIHMNGMFYAAKTFNTDISQWNVSNVSNMRFMFCLARNFNGDISQWDVSNVTDMSAMFWEAEGFNGHISHWDVRNATNMRNMFFGVTLSTEIYDALLQNWSTLPLKSDVQFDGGNSQYSSASESARSILVNTYGWDISDGGLVTPQ